MKSVFDDIRTEFVLQASRSFSRLPGPSHHLLHSNFNTREFDTRDFFSFLVNTSQGEGVTTWNVGRHVVLFILNLPLSVRTRNKGVRPLFLLAPKFSRTNEV